MNQTECVVAYESLKTKEKSSSEGVNCRLQVAGCRLRVAGWRSQVAGCGLQVKKIKNK